MVDEEHDDPETLVETRKMRARIRVMGLRDLDAIQVLYEKLNRELAKTDPISELGENRSFIAWSLKKLRQQMMVEQTYIGAVAESETGDVLGYATGSVEISGSSFVVQHYGLITEIYVDEPYRRQGLGSHLLEFILRGFRERGVEHVELSVAPGDESQDGFFAKHGFRVASVRMIRVDGASDVP